MQIFFMLHHFYIFKYNQDERPYDTGDLKFYTGVGECV